MPLSSYVVLIPFQYQEIEREFYVQIVDAESLKKAQECALQYIQTHFGFAYLSEAEFAGLLPNLAKETREQIEDTVRHLQILTLPVFLSEARAGFLIS